MTKSNKTYDALIIPTGETTFGDNSFPVTKRALEHFRNGRYGCIFITGGYSGFATTDRRNKDSEGKETYDYILNNEGGINPEEVYYDDQSLESVGNFTFPIVQPIINPSNGKTNPNLQDFKNMQVFAKAGHIWRLIDYAKVVMPDKVKSEDVDFYAIPGEHNNGLMAKVYHKGIMNAIGKRRGAEEVHEFLMQKHPFYSEWWYGKSADRRKLEMAAKGGLWNILGGGRVK